MNNENWFYSREKPSDNIYKQQLLNRKKMQKKLADINETQKETDSTRKKISELEKEKNIKEIYYNKQMDIDLATFEGLIRAEKKSAFRPGKGKKRYQFCEYPV